MNDETAAPGATSANVSRRTVMKAAAWSVPVVALAVAAPMAAASAGQATVTTFGTAIANPSNVANGGSVDVSFVNAGMLITGIAGQPWNAGYFSAELDIVNNFVISSATVAGVAVTAAGGTFVSGAGQLWTVTAVDLANSILSLRTVGEVEINPANGASQSFTMPDIVLTGTYVGQVANSGRAVFSLTTDHISGGALPGQRFGS